jgi:DNA mismatch repair protein MutS2
MTSMDDEQSELKGLSSFASEMLKINAIIHAAKTGNHILALIDEPARTTNPVEGQALVNALVDMLQEHKVQSLLTTHYSGIQSDCRRLRVCRTKDR